jgi:hypothetical protein
LQKGPLDTSELLRFSEHPPTILITILFLKLARSLTLEPRLRPSTERIEIVVPKTNGGTRAGPKRYDRYAGLTTGRIKLGQYPFLRYGGKIVFIAQFVPVLRTQAGPFAGANLMPWRSFMLPMPSAHVYGRLAMALPHIGPAVCLNDCKVGTVGNSS